MMNNSYFKEMKATIDSGARLSNGKMYAYRAWNSTVEYGVEIFEAENLPWGPELNNGVMDDFVATLREAGIETIAVTDRSTSLMEELHALFAAGCTIVGPVVVTRNTRWGSDERAGLEIKVN